LSEGIERYVREERRRGSLRIYKPIHALYRRPKSECRFFEVIEETGHYMVRCNVLERILIKEAVVKCEEYWQTCPFRKIGLQMEGEEEEA